MVKLWVDPDPVFRLEMLTTPGKLFFRLAPPPMLGLDSPNLFRLPTPGNLLLRLVTTRR